MVNTEISMGQSESGAYDLRSDVFVNATFVTNVRMPAEQPHHQMLCIGGGISSSFAAPIICRSPISVYAAVPRGQVIADRHDVGADRGPGKQ